YVTSSWEEREKSWTYYLCTVLIIGYLSIGLLFGALSTAVGWITLENLVGALLYTIIILVFYFGLGVRYRQRPINLDNRSMTSPVDVLYLDPAEIEKQR
ncbi:MAG: hypothetical protein ACFFD9_02920, partial [Candidatus Thorarchaeota archaeon]